MMFVIEKLVRYEEDPQEIYQAIKQAWQAQEYQIVRADDAQKEMVCTKQSFHRVRVHILTQCLKEGDATFVQVIYSPALTPAMSRPMSLKAWVEKGVRADLEQTIKTVLNSAGTWLAVPHEAVQENKGRLKDPLQIRNKAKKSTALLRMFLGLGVAGIGTLMSYLYFEDIFRFGSYEMWLAAALIGVIVFCINLFILFWRK